MSEEELAFVLETIVAEHRGREFARAKVLAVYVPEQWRHRARELIAAGKLERVKGRWHVMPTPEAVAEVEARAKAEADTVLGRT